MLLEQPADPRLQMIVAAAKHLHELRHHPQRAKVRPYIPERRPHHRADEGHVAASFFLGNAQKTAELADPGPVMRIGRNPLRIRPFAQCEQHDTPAAPDGGVGERKRQGSAAANDGERGLAVRRLRHPRAHGAASESALPPRNAGIIGGRLPPSRMKDTIFPTTGSSENFVLVRCRRSAKVSSPKNSI